MWLLGLIKHRCLLIHSVFLEPDMKCHRFLNCLFSIHRICWSLYKLWMLDKIYQAMYVWKFITIGSHFLFVWGIELIYHTKILASIRLLRYTRKSLYMGKIHCSNGMVSYISMKFQTLILKVFLNLILEFQINWWLLSMKNDVLKSSCNILCAFSPDKSPKWRVFVKCS